VDISDINFILSGSVGTTTDRFVVDTVLFALDKTNTASVVSLSFVVQTTECCNRVVGTPASY
jgi:hypothetical protein